jgi:glycosyltransferase involved in cell wall biosynthesis
MAYKSWRVYESRSRLAARAVSRLPGRPDAILQIGGLFGPVVEGIPYTTYNDFTTALACREFPEWARFSDTKARDRWFERETALYRGAKRVFTLSNHTRDSMISDYAVPETAVKTVGAGVNFESFPERKADYDGKTLIFVGLDFARKGGPVLLGAFKLVREVQPDARLIIVGQTIRDVPPGVVCAGLVTDRNQMLELYRQASVFTMPSLCEPFGFVFLEAMALGLPCIGTTNDAMPEIIEHGRSGYVVPPQDPNALAEAIVSLLSSREALADMGAHARRRVSEVFTWERTAERIAQEVRQLI